MANARYFARGVVEPRSKQASAECILYKRGFKHQPVFLRWESVPSRPRNLVRSREARTRQLSRSRSSARPNSLGATKQGRRTEDLPLTSRGRGGPVGARALQAPIGRSAKPARTLPLPVDSPSDCLRRQPRNDMTLRPRLSCHLPVLHRMAALASA